jgi:hypothetical protein
MSTETKPCDCGTDGRCPVCATGDEVPAVRALAGIFDHVRAEIEEAG